MGYKQKSFDQEEVYHTSCTLVVTISETVENILKVILESMKNKEEIEGIKQLLKIKEAGGELDFVECATKVYHKYLKAELDKYNIPTTTVCLQNQDGKIIEGSMIPKKDRELVNDLINKIYLNHGLKPEIEYSDFKKAIGEKDIYCIKNIDDYTTSKIIEKAKNDGFTISTLESDNGYNIYSTMENIHKIKEELLFNELEKIIGCKDKKESIAIAYNDKLTQVEQNINNKDKEIIILSTDLKTKIISNKKSVSILVRDDNNNFIEKDNISRRQLKNFNEKTFNYITELENFVIINKTEYEQYQNNLDVLIKNKLNLEPTMTIEEKEKDKIFKEIRERANKNLDIEKIKDICDLIRNEVKHENAENKILNLEHLVESEIQNVCTDFFDSYNGNALNEIDNITGEIQNIINNYEYNEEFVNVHEMPIESKEYFEKYLEKEELEKETKEKTTQKEID